MRAGVIRIAGYCRYSYQGVIRAGGGDSRLDVWLQLQESITRAGGDDSHLFVGKTDDVGVYPCGRG